MQLAYSSNGFTRVNLVTAIERIAAHGYAGVELLADQPHWSPGTSAQLLGPTRAALAQAGIAVSNINANTALALWPQPPPETIFEPSLSNRTRAERERRLAYTRHALDFAFEVGAQCVSVTSGRPQVGVSLEDGFGWFSDSLFQLCVWAEERGLRIGVESEPGLLVERATELLEIIERVQHPGLGANLDIGHARCVGEDPVESIELLKGKIWNLHLEDIRGQKHIHLVPGEGDIDFGAIFERLAAHDYAYFCTVELYTCIDWADEAAQRAFDWLDPRMRAAKERPR